MRAEFEKRNVKLLGLSIDDGKGTIGIRLRPPG